MPRRKKGTAEWIRDYLTDHGPASASEIHREYQKWLDQNDYPTTRFQSTRRELWLLKEIGLVQRLQKGSLNSPGAYGITPNVSLSHDGWSDPTKAKYGNVRGQN